MTFERTRRSEPLCGPKPAVRKERSRSTPAKSHGRRLACFGGHYRHRGLTITVWAVILPSTSLIALACPALPTCGLSLAESERALPALLTGLRTAWEAVGLGDNDGIPTLRMTGCPNGCARPYTAEIGVVGVSLDRYNVYLGGRFDATRLNVLYREKLPLAVLPRVSAG